MRAALVLVCAPGVVATCLFVHELGALVEALGRA